MIFMRSIYVRLLFFSVIVLSSCDGSPKVAGEVARVNGRPITLHQLQAAHDSLLLSWGDPGQEVEALRGEYGTVLTDLIIQELVTEQLEKKKIPVTDKELAAEENIIRADWPAGGFERMLLEESIDLEDWRGMLRRRLGAAKFISHVLRPGISISKEEVEVYFQAHQAELKLPARRHYLEFSSPEQARLAEACAAFIRSKDAAGTQNEFPTVRLREVTMQADRLPPDVAETLARAKPYQASKAEPLLGGFRALVLLESLPERPMSISESYPLIEQALLEDKQERAFNEWIDKRLKDSTILVSNHLLPGKGKVAN